MSIDKTIEILKHLSTAVVICDTDHRIQYLNEAAQMLFGINQQRIANHSLSDLIRKPASFVDEIQAAVDANRPLTMRETPIELASIAGSTTVDCTVTPLVSAVTGDTSTELVTGGLIELHEVDRIMRLVRDTAWRERHEANRAVIQGIAHEVKNPLGGLRGAAQLLERELPDNALRDYTQVIIREADRLNRLVDRMAGPSPRLELTAVNVHDVLEHIRQLIRIETNNDHDGSGEVIYLCDYDPSLPEVAADREQLIQAFLNIVRNAMQAMNYDGVFTVRTRVEHQFTIGQQRHRQVLRVDFIDDGPGVPAHLRDTLFYPLVTGRAEGTGLGLSITQEIIHRLNGLVELHSEPGETQFRIYLPFYHASSATQNTTNGRPIT